LEISNLEFKKIEESRYPIWKIKNDVLNNLDLGVILNAANEVAVSLFLEERIGFYEMSRLIEKAMNNSAFIKEPSLSDYIECDKETREIIYSLVNL
jgi:1-deoxy-D-xylulose-5-phosphate reductoisomerase